jgi:hypothetical protein
MEDSNQYERILTKLKSPIWQSRIEGMEDILRACIELTVEEMQ